MAIVAHDTITAAGCSPHEGARPAVAHRVPPRADGESASALILGNVRAVFAGERRCFMLA
eukprot:CAMPEP_0176087732 /NCGR_PEP_ID=MMETSP0120_2-20121206/43924_1 /TAXON_ID=160619 /ORGANISM="Kryptoperidinium foliaceum, Strain CCMP 1326" /LENGTH=59 /DNA_ID=CAMNT_0017421581 /DNA_START=433 /DNA_END=609 /DNA_ORIENTATION=+